MKNPLHPAILSLFVSGIAAADPLPNLNLEPGTTTVSGLSSGAFMAVQIQVAFSGTISGAGIVAGGPYDCAAGAVWRALFVCMDPFLIEPDAGASVSMIQAMAAENLIDPVDGITPDRLYLFHGQADDTVARVTMDTLSQTYTLLGVSPDDMAYVTSIDAGHGFVTERGPVPCDETRPDFLIDCDFDQAGNILNQLYDDLQQPVEPGDEGFVTFDQSDYTENAPGMDDTAFAYIPASCAEGETCRLHITLHGCKQGRETIGEDYARLTGYNRWAEANGIVILYPQAIEIPSPWFNPFGGNPNGCWDWWGYSGRDHLSKSAPQLAAIANMAAALGAPLD
ncbi:hypothetical protein [Amaricoccus tamworthensis]|uniref:extracellular catalytic domain type 2 short-chain-length polyhydroxyalkanoate depolymerase n=1 Tax=Amaricoccus tamworthensis TaxID=57002 RepID=UPI003C7D11B4